MLTVFERENKEKVLLEIYLESIVSVEEMQDEKGVFPLAIREADRETILAFDDNTSCKWVFFYVHRCSSDWIKRITSLMALRMVSSREPINETSFKL